MNAFSAGARALTRDARRVYSAALCTGERALVALILLPAVASGQMTVSGQVTSSSGAPVQGASVTIDALDIDSRTAADGRYAFIIRQAQVMGQSVSITARHSRFGSQTAQIQIVGGSLEQNFVLASGAPDRPRTQPGADSGKRVAVAVVQPGSAATALADESLGESGGPADLASALAGRHAALHATAANTPGGSSSLLHRGARSLSARVQPLVVVDGVPVDNESFTTIAQRFGQGGFDYGSPLADLALDDVERVELLDPITASVRYGSRAANGVIAVTTKSGRHLTGFSLALTQRFTGQSAALLPDFQSRFGQGLGGQYEFFDGQGGGINDAVAESWGPLMDARPIVQHSLTEPRRPEVRHWIPQPDDVGEFFEGGSTYDANVALQGSRESSHLRAAVNARRMSGLTPGHSARRLGVTFAGGTRLSTQLSATANLQFASANAEQRPGTGFDEMNVVSGFARMGRQVDLDALRANVLDGNGDQINWIYTNRNNPFFATSLNSNDDDRTHIIGGATLSYEVAAWLNAVLMAGTDDWSATRTVSVADGWLGGFPTTLGRGDFSGGGNDHHDISASERLLRLALTATNASSTAAPLNWSAGLGGELRSNEFSSTARVTDQTATSGEIAQSLERTGKHDVTAVFASATAGRGQVTITGGMRLEQSSSVPKSYSVLYPSAQLTYDAARVAALGGLGLGEAKLFARWWQAGNEITRRTAAMMYLPGTVTGSELDEIHPERTTGLELGTRASSSGGRFTFDLVGYRERSDDVLVLASRADGSLFASQSGMIFNGGVEAALGAIILGSDTVGGSGDGISWDLSASVARNSSTVDALGRAGDPGEFEAPLSPNLLGARLAAQVGQAAGIIVGSRLLRNDQGQPLLRDGLPIADASAPFTVFGSVHPDWTASLRSDIRVLGAELSVLFDARVGGKVFSATNLWGSYAGTLESTLIGDRAPGAAAGDSLTIAGVDSVTGAANTVNVSAEQYFHALGSINEPWVYDASSAKLREARLSYVVPTRFLPGFREHFLRVSVIGRNLFTWAKAPNIDPETTLSTGVFGGFEMGQLPAARSVGLQVTISP